MIQIGQENIGIRGLLNGHGRDHSAGTHRTENGQDFPVALGSGFVDAPASQTTGIAPCHLRGHTAFVQINQVFRRGRADFFEELATPLLVGFGVALSRVE